MKRLSYFAALASLTAFTPACGSDNGSDGDLSCEFSPCGGDPTGTWQIANACFEIDPPSVCPDGTVSVDADFTGEITISEDMTYQLQTMATGTVELFIPASCLEAFQITSCSDLEEDGTTCSGDPSTSCTCSESINESETESGTWATSGNQLILDGDEQADYCVSGNTMHLQLSEQGFTSTLVLTR